MAFAFDKTGDNADNYRVVRQRVRRQIETEFFARCGLFDFQFFQRQTDVKSHDVFGLNSLLDQVFFHGIGDRDLIIGVLEPGFFVQAVNVRDTWYAASSRRQSAHPTRGCEVRVNDIDVFATNQSAQFSQRFEIEFAIGAPRKKLNAQRQQTLFDARAQRRVAFGDNEYSMSARAQIFAKSQEIFFRAAQSRRRDVFENRHFVDSKS